MGRQLVSQLLPALEKLEWTGTEEATAAGHTVFQVALDQVDSFRDDPAILGAALRTLRTTDSLPYAYAGVAYLLIAAARETDGDYDPTGLEHALAWLERAQEMSGDVVDINVVEALVYIYFGRFDDARLVLDYLHDQMPNSYYLCRAEMAFWRRQEDVAAAFEWGEKAMQAADTVPQRLRVKGKMGDLYLETGNVEQALQTYREALHFDRQNAELYHKLSLIYADQEEYEEAKRMNEKALSLRPDFTEAQRLQVMLAEKGENDSSGLMGRLFGR